MKRGLSVLCAAIMLVAVLPLAATAEATAVYVTDASYTSIAPSTQDGIFAYTAYDANGNQTIGTMNADGELTREAFSPERWDTLFDETEWTISVQGDASVFCPYEHTHSQGTICPYKQVALVTLQHKQTAVTVENVYMQSPSAPLLPDGLIHVCLGKYGYASPETFRYVEGERYAARRADNGYWGVFDMQRGCMITTYRYSDMSAVYGDYVKVFNGTAWGRLDLSGRMPTAYVYDSADAFSVREEVRAVDGGWQVFSKDNEAMSPVIAGEFSAAIYAPEAAVAVLTAADGSATMVDLRGETVTTFTAQQQAAPLGGACFAVTNTSASGAVTGVALLRVDGAPTAAQTVIVGDVDLNGTVDTADARLILTSLITATVLSERQTIAADADGNGVIDTADARTVLQTVISA